MCGISCILGLEGQAAHPSPSEHINGVNGQVVNGEVDCKRLELERELDASLELIKHRGPDSRGHWISPDNRVALGHVRLAINDLTPDGAQPFHDDEDTIHAVVNGELYDHEAIRADLATKTSYKFKGRSDCEIVIALYKYYGLSFLSHLRGEFALCLYDSRTQFFVAARDRYGIKPLFWTRQDGRLLVAAEAKAFLPLGWRPEWDVKSLLDAGWNHDERTLFKGVAKIRPGHYLTCQSSGHIEQRQYWDIDYPDKRIPDLRSEEEMIEGVRQRLLDAIRVRLRADVPVGVYLSGGIDSSAIAGMVTHLVEEQGEKMGNDKETERVSCFSIAFDEDSGFDESSIANRTADFLGVKYYKKHMSEAALAERFEDATWHCEHHNPDLNFVGKYALSEVPREVGFKVVLTGEGADESFGGYPVYLPDYLREPDRSFPSNPLSEEERLRQLEQTEIAATEYYSSVGADASNRGPSLARRMLNNITTVSSMAAFSLTVYAPWTACYGACDAQQTIANSADGTKRDLIATRWHPLHAAQYVWSKGHLANIFLTCLGDRTEMAHSIEARTPFLDHVLAEYVNGLPPSVKIRWDAGEKRFTEKWILREACRPFITRELYERKKHPYSAPTTYPTGGPLHKLLSGLITRENVESLGFVDWSKAEGLVERAFMQDEPLAMRFAFTIAQWIVISQRFGVRKAEPPVGWKEGVGIMS
ncbi:asparagine synthase (glutamine-hydrolyzing) [Coniosporium apollinis CBS 100218]|uniref:Asparagine synthase (Glutamine-hydrolyzing) n=1 Tax=Coniosporium apollinis (strain CBS 100218) TaxID=1168221 RepID=R7YZQ0_CONA1|nr:asparagine synthase (glutamine-hydrolyzing) [Coniosporium apollinis CBS 100218]EON67269.1 asparagine synthase (glutamine-hydrolyzing) [Coniosporium apollinis CBS 100218]